MKRFFLLLLGLILLGILAYYCFVAKAVNIKNELIFDVQKVFSEKKMNWVNAEIKGNDLDLERVVILNGTAPTTDLRKKASLLATSIEGVTGVENNLQIIQTVEKIVKIEKVIEVVKKQDSKISIPFPYTLQVTKNKESKIILKGHVPNADIHNKIISKAKSLFDPSLIVDNLQETQGSPDAWDDTAILGLEILKDVDHGEFIILNKDFDFKAHVSDNAQKNLLEKNLKDNLNSNYIGEYYFITPKVEVVKVKIPQSCQSYFKDLMSDNKIQFNYNKTSIKQNSYELLEEIVLVLDKCPDDVIEIIGHTDSDGSKKYNKSLSKKRAVSVMNYLIKRGVSSSRVEAVGYGEANPIADNKTQAGKKQNRRIEFIVKGVK